MDKPTLYYVTYFDEGHIRTAYGYQNFVTIPLARSGRVQFLPDSEILGFNRDHEGLYDLSAHITPVQPGGVIGPSSAYFPHGLEFIPQRTRKLYLDMITRGEDIFPIVTPKDDQTTHRYTSTPKRPFPVGNQRLQFERLIRTYLEANPDPYVRLAVISANRKDGKQTLETFLSIAEEFAKPTEIKPKSEGIVTVTPSGQIFSEGTLVLEF